MTPKISVIVPVYKAEAYLHRCVDSLLSQTFQNFEILLVDDGSPDRSGEICDEYARKDSRVRVFHKENGGVSSARNMGLDNARGEWITFVDSDDFVSPTYLMDFGLLSIEESCESKELLIYQGICYWQTGEVTSHFQYGENDSLQCGDSIIEKSSLFMDGCPCGKLYNKNVLNVYHIRFNLKLPLHEDHIFVYTYLLYVKRIVTREAQNYYYRIDYNPNSLTQREIDPNCLIQAGIQLLHFSKCLFAKYVIKRNLQKYFITHYGINQLYRAIWIIMFSNKKDAAIVDELVEIKKVIRFPFIIRNYSCKYPIRFIFAVLFSLIPLPLLVLFLKIKNK